MSSSSMEDSSSDWEEMEPLDVEPDEENEIDQETYQYINSSINNIWESMKNIESDLNALGSTHDEKESPEDQQAIMDDEDDDFLMLFPLTQIDDVIKLESKLSDDSSSFKENLITYITPECQVGCNCMSDMKFFVRTMLRRLFTFKFANEYTWRGFQGNFNIGNLKVVKVIFDITKSKFKNVTKQHVNLLIKEWIKYAKQRRDQLKKLKVKKVKKNRV